MRRRRRALARDVALFLYATRLLIVFTAMQLWNLADLPFDLCYYDLPTNYLILNGAYFHPFSCVIIYLFAVFDFTCQVAFYLLDSGTVTWRWWFQLVVVNQDAYERSRIGGLELRALFQATRENLGRRLLARFPYWRLIPGLIKSTLTELLAKCSIYYQFKHINKEVLFRTPLEVIPGMSNRLRLRSLRFLLFTDQVFAFAQMCIPFFFGSFYLSTLLSYDASRHPWYSKLWVHGEFLLTFLAFWRMCRSAYFFVVCTLLGTIVYSGHTLEVGAPVRQLSQRNRSISPRECLLLHRHLREHNLVCYLVLTASRAFFGNVLLAYLLCHLPVNVFLLARNIYIQQPLLNQIILWAIILVQVGAGAIVLLPLAYCTARLHSPVRYLPALQAVLPGKAWARVYKLKYDSLFGRLQSGRPQMAISIGTLTPITYRTAVEIIAIYLAYTLKAFETVLTH